MDARALAAPQKDAGRALRAACAPPPLQPAYFDAEQASSAAADAETQCWKFPLSAPAVNVRPVRRSPSTSEEQSPKNRRQNRLRPRNLPQHELQTPAEDAAAAVVAVEVAADVSRPSLKPLPLRQSRDPSPSCPPSQRRKNLPTAETRRSQVVTPSVAAEPRVPSTPAAPQRPPKGVVVLAIGLPGSGKSSWFKRHNVIPLSSDMVRSLLFDDVREQRFQDLVFSNLRSMLKARLIAKRPMNYVDATNLTPQERQHWIKLAKDYQYEVHAVFFDVPLEVCLERHQRRDRVVPEDVMRRMAAKLKPPAFEEGFAKITVVRVKKKDSEG